ncbi:VOC family protein [Xanthobacter sp. KR7-65]|uniref:VOC family protein n=1 Tax=Xanthobacter sp. KR7-65 TaxID=3156612 RepID=UPI0032B53DBB
MTARVTPFLMFEGRAQEAMSLYASLFADGVVEDVVRYGPGEPGPEGSVKTARFSLGGQHFMCIDSPMAHGFTFTPSFSLFVTCADEGELDRLFAALGEGGAVLMPPGAYGFSRKFAWVSDRFGVSWQLNLE